MTSFKNAHMDNIYISDCIPSEGEYNYRGGYSSEMDQIIVIILRDSQVKGHAEHRVESGRKLDSYKQK